MMFLFTIGHNLLQANEKWEDWNNDIGKNDLPILGVGDLEHDSGTG